MKELNDMVNHAMQEITESGKIEEMVNAKLEATIKDIIDSELRSYSTFGKALTEHISKALNVNFDLLNLEAYNQMVLNIIQNMLDARLEQATTKRLEADLATLLADPPESMKVSELIEAFIETEQEEATEDGREQISFHHIDDGRSFQYIAWDAQPGHERHLCAYQIGFHDGQPFSFRINGHDPKEKMFMGKLYKFDRLMFQLYAAGVPVELDADNVDTEYRVDCD